MRLGGIHPKDISKRVFCSWLHPPPLVRFPQTLFILLFQCCTYHLIVITSSFQNYLCLSKLEPRFLFRSFICIAPKGSILTGHIYNLQRMLMASVRPLSKLMVGCWAAPNYGTEKPFRPPNMQICIICFFFLALWQTKVSANERSRCICNAFSHWLIPGSPLNRKWAHVLMC